MLPERLRNARKNKKLTQEGLAAKLHTKKQTISNYETGYSSPSNEVLKDLADILEVTTDYLLGRTDHLEDSKEDDVPNRAFHNFEDITEQEKEYLEEQLRIFRKLKDSK